MVLELIFLSLLATAVVSLLGVFVLGRRESLVSKVLIYAVSFSAGAMFGDVFLHILPEVSEATVLDAGLGLQVLLGIVVFFLLEKVVHWHHHHQLEDGKESHILGYMNLFGDALHNFIDGAVIAVSYLVSVPIGVATTLAVIFHEIPQEISDFGVLLHSGFTKKKAIFSNFLVSMTAFLGAGLAVFAQSTTQGLELPLLAFTAGSFVYIAGSDLIPELHKERGFKQGLLQLLVFLLGVAVMYSLTLLE